MWEGDIDLLDDLLDLPGADINMTYVSDSNAELNDHKSPPSGPTLSRHMYVMFIVPSATVW